MAAAPRNPLTCCIECGNPNVRRVATICGPDQWPAATPNTSQGFGHAWGKSHVPPLTRGHSDPESAQSQAANRLARTLAPPPRPVHQRQYALYAALVLIVLGLLCLPLTLALRELSLELANGINIFFFGSALLMFAVGLAEAKTAHEDYESACRRWREAMARWNLLLYCDRCEHVYHPHTGQSAPARNMSALLRSPN